jgi:hypothetical protein
LEVYKNRSGDRYNRIIVSKKYYNCVVARGKPSVGA